MSYIYIKKTSTSVRHQGRARHRLIALILFFAGSGFFIFAVYPILRFQIEYSLKFNRLINPLSTRFYNRSDDILGSVDADFTQLSNWFVSDDSSSASSIPSLDNLTSYRLSIPKLKIDSATVEIGTMDLKKSLVQYPQTALPGQLGNAVVFGHSVLPQFFNPKSYLTIFSTIYRLEPGDEILIDFDNITYKFLVEELFEVQPTDLSVLEQRFDDRYLSLITCSPPGTYLRRLVVRARIVDY